jgi:hypothetical protein
VGTLFPQRASLRSRETLCYTAGVDDRKLLVELEQEEDGRWIAEVPELPGVLVYGQSRAEALTRAEALALRVLAERIGRSG